MTREAHVQSDNKTGSPFYDNDPYDLGSDASADILVMDDRPSEASRFSTLVRALGFKTHVLDRLSTIRENVTAVRNNIRPQPKLIVMDLCWEFSYKTFGQLGRDDLPVPKEPHLRGMVMLTDILSKDAGLAGVPSLLLSSYLGESEADYSHGLATLRGIGMKVEAIAKLHLTDAGGLERVAGAFEKLGLDLPPVDYDFSAGGVMGQPVTYERLDRAVNILAQALEVDRAELGRAWLADTDDNGRVIAERFDRARLAFKIILAAKTVFPNDIYNTALDDLDIMVPGVAIRDALSNAHIRSMRLLAAAFERRVGGPL